MAEIVNLRIARKRKARAEKEKAADENRVRHGLSKPQRIAAETMREREAALHEAHRRDRRKDDGEA